VEADPSVPLDLVYFDSHLAVVQKRAGQIVHLGSGADSQTMVNALVALFPQSASVGEPERPGVVHRLDKGTSGLMVFALSSETLDALQREIAVRNVRRQYLALVEGSMEHDRGTIQGAVGRSRHDVRKMEISEDGREAESHYVVVRRLEGETPLTLVRVVLGTGRTHQIRVHLQALGHPVVGDDVYGASVGLELGRPFLHAERLCLEHPVTKVELDFEAQLPIELAHYLASVEGAVPPR
jgi:23S rRNA pseudouridine1911/1915/1917 synthase